MDATLVILVLALLPAISMLMLVSVMWHRLQRRLRLQQPALARVVIHAFGPHDEAMSRALARYTRLDFSEIDELLEERRTGPLPLPLSWHHAHVLAAELRRLGADVEVERR